MNDRRRQRNKAIRQTQKRILRKVINQIIANCSKNLYKWDQDTTKYSEALREYLEQFAKKFNDTMTEIHVAITNSNLIHVNIKTNNPELINLLQETKSED